jgi:hypothetical protein
MPYIGGFGAYSAKCNDVAQKGYEGFALSMGASGDESSTPRSN